jgi:hypothetical protein
MYNSDDDPGQHQPPNFRRLDATILGEWLGMNDDVLDGKYESVKVFA